MIPMNLNTPTYVLSASTSSSGVTLTPEHANQSSLVIYSAASVPVFLVSGYTAPTAVFPTSATVPVNGKVIPPGAMVTFTKNVGDTYLAGITAPGTGSGSVYISPGAGE